MGLRMAGIQPGYLPWLGYFDQMLRVDLFVIADELQFTTSGWTHRNRVRSPRGAHWLTLPVRGRAGQRIDEVTLDPRSPWRKKHSRTLRHFYAKSPHARDLLDALGAAVAADAARLVDVSIPAIRFLAERFGVATPIVLSSALGLEASYAARAGSGDGASATHRIVSYMESLGATELLEGETGRSYLDLGLCAARGVRVEFHRFDHPVYHQLFDPFVSHLSALDLLLVAGEHEARAVLQRGA